MDMEGTMTEVHHCKLANEAETLALAKKFSEVLQAPLVVYLKGELGAGKTAFCRGVIQALGHCGAVKSPTYTLIEWPDKGYGWLPGADIEIRIEYAGEGRKITFSALTEAGQRIIKTL